MYGHRHCLRLKNHDYAKAGAYFITICTGAGSCLFGTVTEKDMNLNAAGQMALDIWDSIPEHYAGVEVDQFVVRPNHVHGIVVLQTDDGTRGPGRPQRTHTDRDQGAQLSLPDVVHRFKSLTTARYRHGVTEQAWRRFTGTLWQRNYYEHVIRTEDELTRVRKYIVQNPLQWHLDHENPDRRP